MHTIEQRFVSLDSPTGARNGAGFMPTQGLYHHRSGDSPRTAFIASHYNVDFSEHYLATRLAALGYGFLGWNTRFRGAEQFFTLDNALVDIGVGVRWLREEAGVETVVLMANCGGGSLMGAYQAQATAGVLRPLLDRPVPEAALDLSPADLYVSLNAHPGRPEVLTNWFDPSLTDENDPASVDPTLDMYDPDNGPPYTADFVERYRAAQVARNRRITAWALEELERLRGQGLYDRLFSMSRTWADLRFLDGTIDPSERQVGTCYAGDPRFANYSPFGIGSSNTIRTWLSMWSLEHSQCRGAPNLAHVTVPSLVIQSTADTGVFPSDAQSIFDGLATDDKMLEWVAGDHYLQDPSDARDAVAGLINDWVEARVG